MVKIRRFDAGYFFVAREEVQEVMRRTRLATVTAAMRLLFPRLAFYRLARHGGYYGREQRATR